MKRAFFALAGAFSIALLPIGAHATTTATDENGNCYIEVSAGESATINYDTKGCYVVNNGNLTIANGANIFKKTRGDKYAAINNNGNLTINGGYIEAYYGYGIFHNAKTLTINGGTINVPLHQVIWAKGGTTTTINAGNFKSAIGGEEAIYTLGSLSICGGNFNAAKRSNLGTAKETETCKKDEPVAPVTPSKTDTPTTPAKAETKKATIVKTVAKQSESETETPAPIAEVLTPKPQEEKKTVKLKENKIKNNDKKEEQDEQDGEANNTAIIVAAIAIVLANAGVAVALSHRKH